MAGRPIFTIDLKEKFPHLAAAPIAEAVIHWRATAGKSLDKLDLQNALKAQFEQYECREQQEQKLEFEPAQERVRHETRWNGFRLTSNSRGGGYVAQFTPHGLVFSRLPKYDRWVTFESEALRFWRAYVELAQPPLIERLGVRFINQIQLKPTETPADFLKHAPIPPSDLPLDGDQFFHQDSYRVSGHPYHLNSVRTLQTMPDQQRVLIVDTDVAVESKDLLEPDVLERRLGEMRHIKNRLFFAYMTEYALKQFGRDDNA